MITRRNGVLGLAIIAALLCVMLSTRAIAQDAAIAPASDDASDDGTSDASQNAAPAEAPPDEPSAATDASDDASVAEPDASAAEADASGDAAPSDEASNADGDASSSGDATEEVLEPVVREGLLPDGSLDPCATNLRPRPIGPLSVGELDGQLGVPYRACPRNEVAIGGDVLLVADTARFYGDIRANGRLRASVLLDRNVEGFVSWEAFRYQTVISSVSASYLGLGYLSYGATGRIYSEKGRVYAITGRMVLPTTSGLDQSSQPLALDVGITGAWQADANFRFHMWATLLGSIGIGGPAEPRGGLRLGGGVDWRPYEWISFVFEIQSGFFYRDVLDLLAANAGVRLALGTEVGLELAAQLPFLGVRGLDTGALPLAGTLTVSWRLR